MLKSSIIALIFAALATPGLAQSPAHAFIRPRVEAPAPISHIWGHMGSSRDTAPGARPAPSPRPGRRISAATIAALGGYAAVVVGDLYSTRVNIELGAEEGNLIFRNNTGGTRYALNIGISAGVGVGAIYLERRGHPWLARAVLIGAGIARGWAWRHNESLKGELLDRLNH